MNNTEQIVYNVGEREREGTTLLSSTFSQEKLLSLSHFLALSFHLVMAAQVEIELDNGEIVDPLSDDASSSSTDSTILLREGN